MPLHISVYLWHSHMQCEGTGLKNNWELSSKSTYSFVFPLKEFAQDFWNNFCSSETNTNTYYKELNC